MPPSDIQKILDSMDPEVRDQFLKDAENVAAMQRSLTVTSSEEWKTPRKAGFLLQLPSGNVGRVKRTLSLLDMVKNGSIPNPLGATINSNIHRGNGGLKIDELSVEEKIQALDLIDQCVIDAMVEPRVIAVPEGVNPELFQAPPGAITLMDLTVEDRIFITQVAQGGATDVERFREEQKRIMGTLRDDEVDVVPPKQPARPKRSRSGSGRNK